MAPHFEDDLLPMDGDDSLTYEEKRRTVKLLERLTAKARLELVREGNLIEAPVMQASAEGVLISEVLGIFLFLFLLLGMVVFFHKETNCGSGARHRLCEKARRMLRALRRRMCRFDREWNCEEEGSSSDTSQAGTYRDVSISDDVTVISEGSSSDTSQAGTYRDISSANDVTGPAGKPEPVLFDHREALLELFADLELHREAVRDSIRGYSAALSRLNDPGSGHQLRGILRQGGAPGHGGKHRHHHHRHHRRTRADGTTAETELTADTAGPGGEGQGTGQEHTAETVPVPQIQVVMCDVTQGAADDVTGGTGDSEGPRVEATEKPAEVTQDQREEDAAPEITVCEVTEAPYKNSDVINGADTTSDVTGKAQLSSDVTSGPDSSSGVTNEPEPELQSPAKTNESSSTEIVTTAPDSDITASPPASDVTTAPDSDITASPSASDVTTAPASDVTTASASDVTTASASDVTTAPTSDVTTAPASDVTTAPASDVTTAPASDVNTASGSDAIASPPDSDAASDATAAAGTSPATEAGADSGRDSPGEDPAETGGAAGPQQQEDAAPLTGGAAGPQEQQDAAPLRLESAPGGAESGDTPTDPSRPAEDAARDGRGGQGQSGVLTVATDAGVSTC